MKLQRELMTGRKRRRKKPEFSGVAVAFGVLETGLSSSDFERNFIPKSWDATQYQINFLLPQLDEADCCRHFSQSFLLKNFRVNLARSGLQTLRARFQYMVRDRMLRWIRSIPGADSSAAFSGNYRPHAYHFEMPYYEGSFFGQLMLWIIPRNDKNALLIAELLEEKSK